WNGLDMRALGYEVAEMIQGERATHVMVRKQA
ncbi:deaminase, partial [Streptococcus sp. WM07]